VADQDCLDALLSSFKIYDRAVDVVSIFEMLFTKSQTLPPTVRHFERFPRIPLDDQSPLTPDFSVLFGDGGGLVGEIAHIARREESVDSVCKQIGRYDEIPILPDGTGLSEVDYIDVLLLVPQHLGPAALKRILEDRADNDDHWYAPQQMPCIVQFGYDDGRYTLQRPPHPSNGMPRDDARDDGLSKWFPEGINVKPELFKEIKAARAFVNDGVDRLYLATHLWSKTFPTEIGEPPTNGPVRLEVDAADLAQTLRERHGHVRKKDIVAALDLLTTGRLAERASETKWVIAYEPPKRGEKELHANFAERICKPPGSGPIDRLARPKPAPSAPSPAGRLF
jgi:hypothetical protein